jgi:hypothetical protein
MQGMYGARIVFKKSGEGALAIDDLDIFYGGVANVIDTYKNLNAGNALNHTIAGLGSGKKYYYQVWADNGSVLSRKSNEIAVNMLSNVSIVDNNEYRNKVYAYNNQIYIKPADDKVKKLRLFTIEGNMLVEKNIEGEYIISSSLPKGVYIVTLNSDVYKILLK